MSALATLPDPKNRDLYRFLDSAVARHPAHRAVVIGIGGVAGTGKTTLGKGLKRYWGRDRCVWVELDDYQIPRQKKREMGITGNEPQATQFDRARRDIRELQDGRPVLKPIYDCSCGESRESEVVLPRRMLILTGHTALRDGIRQLCDITLFLDADEEVQFQVRQQRDVLERGYAPEVLLALWPSLVQARRRFVEPEKECADAVFQADGEHRYRKLQTIPEFENVVPEGFR